MDHPRTSHGIDLARAAARIREQDRERERRLARRYEQARRDLEGALEIVRRYPQVRRVRVWGSLLDAVGLPLDLVRWEPLMQPHRESIVARGKVEYESS